MKASRTEEPDNAADRHRRFRFAGCKFEDRVVSGGLEADGRNFDDNACDFAAVFDRLSVEGPGGTVRIVDMNGFDVRGSVHLPVESDCRPFPGANHARDRSFLASVTVKRDGVVTKLENVSYFEFSRQPRQLDFGFDDGSGFVMDTPNASDGISNVYVQDNGATVSFFDDRCRYRPRSRRARPDRRRRRAAVSRRQAGTSAEGDGHFRFGTEGPSSFLHPGYNDAADPERNAPTTDRIRATSTGAFRGDAAMPSYQFECKKCGHRFEVKESVGDHDKHEEKCPECGSTDVASVITPVNVRTRKKS